MSSYRFVIEADDACLDGHFPGDPLVPAVVILEAVLAYAAEQSGSEALTIERCKFLQPLRPGQPCVVQLNAAGTQGVRFECQNEQGETLAAGRLRMDVGTHAN